MTDGPQTWHYGVVAQWWAEFNVGGPEIDYYQAIIQRHGQPVLDVACGAGRLMLPMLRAGLDVDGCDVSPDMVELCRASCERAGFAPRLYTQPMHELDVPRTYSTIFVCGGFGLGGDRRHDQQALHRFRAHLMSGGALIIDIHVPYESDGNWQFWQRDGHRMLPEPWGPPPTASRASDGTDLALQSRVVDVNPISQVITREMHASRWRAGQLEAEEYYTLKERLYFPDELLMMLEQAGFEDIRLEADYTHNEVTSDAEVLIFIARSS